MKLLYLNPSELESDPDGMRDSPGNVDGLAETIADQGMLQPLGVVQMDENRYRVVYGNRRRAAAVQLGMPLVPCILLDADDKDLLLRKLIENVQREELNDIEKARAFARLRARLVEMHTHQNEGELDDEMGRAIGLTGRTVRRYLGLLDLPDEVQQLIRAGQMHVTQAQHLRRIPNRNTQIELARAAVEEGMSAADLSRLAGYFAANPDLTLETALHALEQGHAPASAGGVPASLYAGSPPQPGSTLRSPDSSDADGMTNDDFWSDEEEESGDDISSGGLDAPPDMMDDATPKPRSRVFRIRSLDQMVDETDRLARAYVEGDLVKWVQKDEGAPFKVRLLLKQLDTLMRALRDLAQQQGWEGEE